MKEFFKPTKSKIIIVVILFLLLPVPYQMVILGGPNECGGLKTCILGHKTSFATFGGLFFIVSIFVGGNQPFETAVDYLWKLPYLAIVSYLLSCCIVYSYRRIKK